jgi:hypothetical protein
LIVGPKLIHIEDIQDWNQTNGYFVNNQHARKMYDYQLGWTSFAIAEEATNANITIVELPLERLPELFALLGNMIQIILDAISCSLELWSFTFMDFLDNMPRKIGEMSISILSTCCHNKYL